MSGNHNILVGVWSAHSHQQCWDCGQVNDMNHLDSQTSKKDIKTIDHLISKICELYFRNFCKRIISIISSAFYIQRHSSHYIYNTFKQRQIALTPITAFQQLYRGHEIKVADTIEHMVSLLFRSFHELPLLLLYQNQIIWLSNLLTMREPDECYSRSSSCVLHYISTLYYR